jgi:hypothetical protein
MIMQQVIYRIYRIGPVTMTAVVWLMLFRFTPSRTEHGIWVACVAYSFVGVALIWHVSLFLTTTRPKGEMILYAILNLPFLWFLTGFYASLYAIGPRFYEYPP